MDLNFDQMRIVLIAFLLILLSACEEAFTTTLKIDPPAHEPQMAVHLIVRDNATDLIAGSITESRGILDPEPDQSNVSTALMNLSTPQWTIGPFQYNSGSYGNRTNFKAVLPGRVEQNGSQFDLSIDHDVFPQVQASAVMPQRVGIKDIVFVADSGINGDSEEVSGIDFTIQDPGGVENFYEIQIHLYDTIQQTILSSYSIFSFDPNTFTGINGEFDILMQDNTFDGQDHEISILLDRQIDVLNTNRVLMLVWRSITEDLFLYSRSVNLQNDSEDFGPFAEPVSIHTNVNGGYGIFGLSTEERFLVSVP